MVSIEQIIERARKYLPDLNEKRVMEAFEFAKECHKEQKRSSGEPYIYHPLAIANNLLDFVPDEDTIVAALLHDVTEDCDIPVKDIEKKFGKTVALLVEGMEKLSHLRAKGEERQIGSLRKMFLAMAKDIRVVLIKLVDRLHNMSTLHYLRKDKQERIASETLSIYAPIAARLGIYELKGPLEDLSFFYLYPKDYADIAQQLKKHEPYRTRILRNAKKSLQAVLDKNEINGEIVGRVKHYYSIYKKMQRKNSEDIDGLYDIFALRILVPTIKDCYIVLGRIHQYWTPLANRFKDYIAVPKPNGYRSLHTTVIGLSGLKTRSVPIEIQIKTQEMHHEAEYGVAAHWAYKEDKTHNPQKSVWVKQLADIDTKVKSNREFVRNLELDTFSDRIFALTPNGDIKDLPKDATPIDFAFAIHTDIGLHIRVARVNGSVVPLNHTLENGDVVEIVTSKNSFPHQNWLSYVKTTTARNRIRHYLKSQDREKIIKQGKDLLNKHLLRFGAEELDPHLRLLKEYGEKKLSMREREELLERVGNGSLSAVAIVKKLLKGKIDTKTEEKLHKAKVITPNLKGKSEILIAGEPKIPVKLANCCRMKEGDPIVGFVTRGGHVTVHLSSCKTLKKLDQNRLVEARWASDKSTMVTFRVYINTDRVGLLRDVIDVFVQHNVNLDRFGYSEKVDHLSTEVCLRALIKDFDLVAHLMESLEQVDGVSGVRRE